MSFTFLVKINFQNFEIVLFIGPCVAIKYFESSCKGPYNFKKYILLLVFPIYIYETGINV